MEMNDNEAIGLKRIVVDYLRRWKLFLGAFLFSLVLAVLYIVLVPRTYEIMARIKIQDNNNNNSTFGLGEAAGLMKSFGLGGGASSVISIDDEIATLTSNSLLRQLILKLGLNVSYMKPGAYKYSMYDNVPLQLSTDSTTALSLMEEIEFTVSLNEQGKGKVIVEDKTGNAEFEIASLPTIVSLSSGKYTIKYRDGFSERKSLKMKMIICPVSWIAEDMADNFLVEEVSKSSSIIEMTCFDYEYKRGVDVLNTLINEYNQSSEFIKKKEATKSLSFIEGRLDNVMSELHQTEVDIEKYKLKNGMTDIEYDVQFYVGQMQELQVKIIELEAQSHVINMMDAYVKDPNNKYNLVPMLMTMEGGDKSGGPITLYNEKLLERSRLLQSSKIESPLINQITEQVDKLRESVFLSISNARKGLLAGLAELKSKEKFLLDKMGTVPTLEREFVDYKRQQEILQGVYLILLQKREELALNIGEEKDKALIIDNAFVKKKTVAPRKLYAGLAVILFTLIIPILVVQIKTLYIALKEEYKRTSK